MGFNLKAKLSLLAGALCSALCVGVGYSVFVFQGESSNNKDFSASAKVNDVLEDSGAEDNTYVVYYFSSPFYANYFRQVRRNKKQSFDDYLAAFETNFSTYSNGETNRKNIGYFDGDGEEATKGYYTKSYTGALDADFITNAPTPLSSAVDKSNWPVRFSGWTANMYAAINCGFRGQGDYKYVESSQSLGYIDSQWVSIESESSTDTSNPSKIAGIDGSEVSPQGDGTSFIGDHRIFLFPVLTTGKDYSTPGKRSGVVRLHDSVLETSASLDGKQISYFSDERYFARKDDASLSPTSTSYRNGSYFYYKNLLVKKNDVFYLDFLPSIFTDYGSDWYNFWDSNGEEYKGQTFDAATYGGWNTTSSYNTYPNKLCPLIDGTGGKSVENHETAVSGPGLYNIYVYAHNFGGTSETDAFKNFATNKWNYSGSQLSTEFESLSFNEHSFVWFEDPNPNLNYISGEEKPIVDSAGNAQVMTSISFEENANYYCYKVYVKIEKVYDVHYIGGDTGSLDYNKGISMIPIAGARFESKSSFFCYYRLDHVYLDGKGDYIWKEDDDGYRYSSNLFGILLEGNEGRVVDSLTDEETGKVNDYFTNNYHRKNTFSQNNPKTGDRFFSRLSVGDAVNNKYLQNSDKLPFDPGNNQMFLSSNSDGYFDVLVQVVFDYGKTNEVYKAISVKSVKVTMSNSSPKGPTVWIYGNEDDIPYRTIEEVQFVDTDLLFDEETSKGWVARINIPESTAITMDTVVETHDDKFMKLSEFMGDTSYNPSGIKTAKLLEHQTKTNMLGNKIVRNYAAILG